MDSRAALERIARRLLAAAGVAIGGLTLVAIARVWWTSLGTPVGVDFLSFYSGAVLVRVNPTALYDVAQQRAIQSAALRPFELAEGVLPFAYPPFVAAALAPLGALPYRVAYPVATILNLVCALLVLGVLMRRRVRATAARRWLLLFAAMTLPVSFTVLTGQVSLVVLLLVALVVVDLDDGHDRRAGVWLGLLSLKPQLAVLLFLVAAWRRQWRAVGVAALVVALLWSASLALVGAAGMRQFAALIAEMGRPEGTAGVHPEEMHNLRALWLVVVPGGGMLAWGWLLPAFVVALLALWSHRRRDPERSAWQWSATVIALMLVSPHLYPHDLALLLLPTALLLGRATVSVGLPTVLTGFALAVLPLAGQVAWLVTDRRPPVVATALVIAFVAFVWCGERAATHTSPPGVPGPAPP